MTLAKNTKILGMIALIMAAISIFHYSGDNAKISNEKAGEAYFPSLENVIGDAREIVLSGQEAVTTLRFDGAIWRIEERSNYPANLAYVQDMLSGLIRANRIEPKTSNSEFFDRLGLNDSAIEIQVLSSSGEALATLIAGDQFFSPSGDGVTTFVNDTFDGRAWTVAGLPQLSSYPAFWLSPDVLGLSPFRVKGFSLSFGDGQVWSASRQNLESVFSLNQGEGGAADPAVLQRVANALNEIILEDVVEFTSLQMFPVASAEYQTFDGLIIKMDFFDNEGTIWTTLEARFDEAVLLDENTPSVLVDAPPDGVAEVNAMNALWEGRAYRIPIEKISVILTRLEALSDG